MQNSGVLEDVVEGLLGRGGKSIYDDCGTTLTESFHDTTAMLHRHCCT
jgi:hypothetical protein